MSENHNDDMTSKKPPVEAAPEEMLEPTAVEEDDETYVPKTGFALRVEEMGEQEWSKWSMFGGIALALIASAFLFLYPASENSVMPMGSLIAFALVLILPGYIERRLERPAPRMRMSLIITLAVSLALYIVFMLLSGRAGS